MLTAMALPMTLPFMLPKSFLPKSGTAQVPAVTAVAAVAAWRSQRRFGFVDGAFGLRPRQLVCQRLVWRRQLQRRHQR